MLEWIDGTQTSCPSKKEKLVNLEVLNQAVELVQEKEKAQNEKQDHTTRTPTSRSAKPECPKDHKDEVLRPDFLEGSQDVVLSPIT